MPPVTGLQWTVVREKLFTLSLLVFFLILYCIVLYFLGFCLCRCPHFRQKGCVRHLIRKRRMNAWNSQDCVGNQSWSSLDWWEFGVVTTKIHLINENCHLELRKLWNYWLVTRSFYSHFDINGSHLVIDKDIIFWRFSAHASCTLGQDISKWQFC